MNILHLNDKIEISGGVEVYIQDLMELLPEYSVNVFWLGIQKKNGCYSLQSFQHECIKTSNLSFDKLLELLKSYIFIKAIDLIHIHSISDPNLIKACFELRPVVRSMHDPRIVCPGHGKFWRLSEEVCNQPFGLHCIYHAYKEGCSNRHPKRLLQAYNNVLFETTKGAEDYKAIIAMSNYMRDEALKVGFNQNQLSINPYFTPFVIDSDLKNSAEDSNKSLLFVGRLSRTKGVHYFINTGVALLKMGYNITLDIVGDGHDRGYFESLIPSEFIKHFKFHGWQNRVKINDFFKNCYLLVFPSIYPEAFGISGIEAMMHGKPVVGFDVGGVSTWLKNGETGYLGPSKDMNLMVQKVSLLLENKELYLRMSIQSRFIALYEFSPKSHLKKLKEIYEKALQV